MIFRNVYLSTESCCTLNGPPVRVRGGVRISSNQVERESDMTLSKKLAGIALLLYFAWLPFASDFHSSAPNDEAVRESYETVGLPTIISNQYRHDEARFCLLGAPHCAELYKQPVEPCLLGVEKCSGEARVQLLVQIQEPQ